MSPVKAICSVYPDLTVQQISGNNGSHNFFLCTNYCFVVQLLTPKINTI